MANIIRQFAYLKNTPDFLLWESWDMITAFKWQDSAEAKYDTPENSFWCLVSIEQYDQARALITPPLKLDEENG